MLQPLALNHQTAYILRYIPELLVEFRLINAWKLVDEILILPQLGLEANKLVALGVFHGSRLKFISRIHIHQDLTRISRTSCK
jgi:hypothetical protein